MPILDPAVLAQLAQKAQEGRHLDFKVGWSADKGVYIETK